MYILLEEGSVGMVGVCNYWLGEESEKMMGFSGLALVGLCGLVREGHLGL